MTQTLVDGDIGDIAQNLLDRVAQLEQRITSPYFTIPNGSSPTFPTINVGDWRGTSAVVPISQTIGSPTSLTGVGNTTVDDVAIDASWAAPVDGTAVQYQVDTALKINGTSIYSLVDSRLTAGTSAHIGGLLPNATYGIRVSAINRIGVVSSPYPVGGWVDVHTTGDSSIPNQVTGVVATPAATSIMLTWTENIDADVAHGVGWYEIEVTTTTGGITSVGYVNASTNIAAFTGLSTSSTYTYRVRAHDSSGNVGPWSSPVTASPSGTVATSGSDGSPPASSPTPTVIGTAGPALVIKFGMITNNDPVIYEIHLSTTSGFTPSSATKATESGSSNVIIFKDAAGAALVYGTTYYCKIIAKDPDGAAAASAQGSGTPALLSGTDITSVAFSQVHDGTPPSSSPTPVLSSGLGYLFAHWTAVANNDMVTYEVHVSTTSGFTPSGSTKVAETTSTIAIIRATAAGAALAYGTTYFVKLVAKDIDGSAAASAQASGTVSQVTSTDVSTLSGAQVHDGAAPSSSPTPTVLAGLGYLYASWTAVANNDPVTYEVHLSTTTGFTPSSATKVAEVLGTSVIIKSLPGGGALAYGTTYFIRLVAKDLDGSAAAGTQASGVVSKVSSTDLTTISGSQVHDGAAPASSPTPLIASGMGYLLVYWTAIANNDAVTYEVHISTTTGFTPSGATKVTETASTSTIVRTTAAGAALAYGTTYFVKLIAKDADGSAAASAQASGAPAQVTTTDITANAVTANQIAANTITAAQIAAGTITAAQIAAGTITAGLIAANTITAGQIAANTITAAQIAANTITAGQIAAGTITATQIAAGTITGSLIAADTITATQIAAGAITASELAANSVTAAAILAGTITATQIAANTITAAQMATGTITAASGVIASLDASKITTGTMNASFITAGTIASDRIVAAGLDAGVIKFGTMSGDRITANTLDVAALKTSTLSAVTITLASSGNIVGGTNPLGGTPTGFILNGGAFTTYKAGATTFRLDFSTGNAFFAGDITGSTGTFSGTVSGATIIGGVFETSTTSTGDRIVIDTSGGISLYREATTNYNQQPYFATLFSGAMYEAAPGRNVTIISKWGTKYPGTNDYLMTGTNAGVNPSAIPAAGNNPIGAPFMCDYLFGATTVAGTYQIYYDVATTAGQAWATSMYLSVSNVTGNQCGGWTQFLDASKNVLSSVAYTRVTDGAAMGTFTANQWSRYGAAGTAPANTAYVRQLIQMAVLTAAGSWQGHVYLYGAQIENKDHVTVYCDGNQYGSTWASGNVDSTSSRPYGTSGHFGIGTTSGPNFLNGSVYGGAADKVITGYMSTQDVQGTSAWVFPFNGGVMVGGYPASPNSNWQIPNPQGVITFLPNNNMAWQAYGLLPTISVNADSTIGDSGTPGGTESPMKIVLNAGYTINGGNARSAQIEVVQGSGAASNPYYGVIRMNAGQGVRLSGVAGAAQKVLTFATSFNDYTWYADDAGPTGGTGDRVWLDGPSGGALYLGPRGGSSFFNTITLRATNITFAGIATTTGTTPVAVLNASSVLLRSTSSKRYKKNIRKARTPFDALLGIQVKEYQGVPDMERGDNRYHTGLIAEELHEAGLGTFVSYDELERPDGIGYDRLTVALLAIIQNQDARLRKLEASR